MDPKLAAGLDQVRAFLGADYDGMPDEDVLLRALKRTSGDAAMVVNEVLDGKLPTPNKRARSGAASHAASAGVDCSSPSLVQGEKPAVTEEGGKESMEEPATRVAPPPSSPSDVVVVVVEGQGGANTTRAPSSRPRRAAAIRAAVKIANVVDVDAEEEQALSPRAPKARTSVKESDDADEDDGVVFVTPPPPSRASS